MCLRVMCGVGFEGGSHRSPQVFPIKEYIFKNLHILSHCTTKYYALRENSIEYYFTLDLL